MFFIEQFHASPKIINRSSKILCKLKFCVCDNGTHAGDNCSSGCSLSALMINSYSCETLSASELRSLFSKTAVVLTFLNYTLFATFFFCSDHG